MTGTPSIDEVRETLTAPGQMCEVTEVDVDGVPTKVWKNTPPSLRAVLEMSRMHGDKTFVVYEDERLTFEEHFRRSATLANRLVERYGIEKGDRVAIAMRNFPEWIVAFWGAAAAGAVVVPLNAWWTGAELEYGIADSGAKVLICDGERLERLRSHLGSLDLAGVIVARPDGDLDDQEEEFASVLGDIEADVELPDVELEPDDDATIFYTSGTTGKPKGALGTHRNICTNLLSLVYGAMASAMRKGGGGDGDGGDGDGLDLDAMASGAAEQSIMVSVPLFHVTGCHAFMLGSVGFGAKLVLMHKWDAERALDLIEREKVTTFGGVPAMVWQVLESPSFKDRDISSVQSIGYGGAPAPPELVRRIDELFPGRTPSNGWGMTETSSAVTSNGGADYLRKPDSVGPPLPICEAKIVDEDGNDVEQGGTGELMVKGPNVVKEYWNKPEATEETFVDGWIRTGDIAKIDDEGFIYIVDRAKDMVIRGGENVYCAEVEGVLFEHPAVTDCAVFGIPHERLGEEVGAVVQLKDGASATEEELQAHVKDKLANFKVPKQIWFWDEELPRNPAGKILKRDLRDKVLADEG